MGKYSRFTILITIVVLVATGPACMGTRPVKNYRTPKIGLVLGGGSARGFAHIGVIRVLEQEKIPMDLIVGTSVGSLIGVLYASKGNSFDLEWMAFEIKKEDLFDFSLRNMKKGLAKGEALVKFLNENIPVKNMEELEVPMAAVAVNLNTGEKVVMDSGAIDMAIRASTAIPGIFQPVELPNGQMLVDGGVVGNIAPEVAWHKGMDLVIAVDIGEDIANDETGDIMSIIMQSISIMSKEIVTYKHVDADVLIKPGVGKVGMMDFDKKKELIQAGIEATREAIPEIRKAIKQWQKEYGLPES